MSKNKEATLEDLLGNNEKRIASAVIDYRKFGSRAVYDLIHALMKEREALYSIKMEKELFQVDRYNRTGRMA